MTRDEWDMMSAIAQRLYISKLHKPHEIWTYKTGFRVVKLWKLNGVSTCYEPLDYLNSLDAMHNAEKHLTKIELTAYANLLGSGRTGAHAGLTDKAAATHATAAQKAEAFVITVEDRK